MRTDQHCIAPPEHPDSRKERRYTVWCQPYRPTHTDCTERSSDGGRAERDRLTAIHPISAAVECDLLRMRSIRYTAHHYRHTINPVGYWCLRTCSVSAAPVRATTCNALCELLLLTPQNPAVIYKSNKRNQSLRYQQPIPTLASA